MRRKNTYFFPLLVIITISFLFLIAFDIFPILRGPAPYPPEWQWPYLVSNTFTKIWFPLLVASAILFIAYLSEINNRISQFVKQFFLPTLIILGFLFHIALLFYSRGGINILFHRILNPLISGYFTVSLSINSVGDFLRDFTIVHPSYPMYAKFHPPFSVLFFNVITFLSAFVSPFFTNLLQRTPSHQDVALIWNSLTATEQTSALLSGFMIILLTTLAFIPLYKSGQLLSDETYSRRLIFLFLFIPSVLLFTPLNDSFMPLLSATTLYFFLRGLKNNSKYGYFLSGLFLSIGALFSLTFLPLIGFFVLLGSFTFIQQKKFKLPLLLIPVNSFAFGFLLLPFFLFILTGYNFVENIFSILHHHNIVEHQRNYLTGLWYAPFDFFLFLGIPISIFVIFGLFNHINLIRNQGEKVLQKIDPLIIAFWLFIAIVTISGSVRVESARIWTPFIPFALLAAIQEMQRRNISTSRFLVVLILLAVQVILFQSVLVTVW